MGRLYHHGIFTDTLGILDALLRYGFWSRRIRGCIDYLTMKKSTYHHKDLRNALIQAAGPLLAEHGVAALSLREVAKAAGVSHAAPYRHFRDKNALLGALAATGFVYLQNACVKARKKFPDDPARQLTEAGTAYLLYAVDNPEIVHLMFGGVVDFSSGDESLAAAAQSAHGQLVAIIHAGQQQGVFRAGSTEDLALTAWSTVHGLALMLPSGFLNHRLGSRKSIRELGQEISAVLYAGLLAE